jgi:tRNA1(Val) A37 N6-methylase TrmN6
MQRSAAKLIGQFYSPQEVATTLVNWLQIKDGESLLDPSCGDGRFISQHNQSVGVDSNVISCAEARSRAPWATVHHLDFFDWAKQCNTQFDCAAGNPPFIRYHNFTGNTRARALELCASEGAKFSALTSSWAPFLVVSSSLLKRGGRMAFVVPAEIGHASYSATLLEYLTSNFDRLLIVAIKEKIFSQLSEDVWLLYASGKGGQCKDVDFVTMERFCSTPLPLSIARKIGLSRLRSHRMRLRRFLLPDSILDYYSKLPELPKVINFGSIARISIGYVTGANDFFHLRPSQALRLKIPNSLLRVAIRKGDQLSTDKIDRHIVGKWLKEDKPVLLLDLSNCQQIPSEVLSYLQSDAAIQAQTSYKCRNREPWYVVPDVSPPDAFLSYMSGKSPSLVDNRVACVCTNSVHAVRLKQRVSFSRLSNAWKHPVCDLSIEIEGHPLGGGLFKIEPGEATRILLSFNDNRRNGFDYKLIQKGIEIARSWRHCG